MRRGTRIRLYDIMKSSINRSKRYKAKIRGMVLPGQASDFARAVHDQVRTELDVKNILTRRGVMVGLVHFYMDFGKKVRQIMRNYTGGTMRDEIEALQVHWARRGLDVAVLDDIKGWVSVTGFCFKLDHSLLDGPDLLC